MSASSRKTPTILVIDGETYLSSEFWSFSFQDEDSHSQKVHVSLSPKSRFLKVILYHIRK